MKCVLNTSTASQRSCVFAQRNGGVLHHGLCTCHRRMALGTGGKWVSRASSVERTFRAKKRWAEDSFQSWCVERGLVGQDQMDHGSDRLGLGEPQLPSGVCSTKERLCSDIEQVFWGKGDWGFGASSPYILESGRWWLLTGCGGASCLPHWRGGGRECVFIVPMHDSHCRKDQIVLLMRTRSAFEVLS